MLRVFPSVFEFLEVPLGRLAECLPFGLRELRGGPGLALCVERVLSLPDEQARLTGHLRRVGWRHRMKRAQPHLALSAVAPPGPADLGIGRGVAEDPGPVDLAILLAAADLQPKAAPIA